MRVIKLFCLLIGLFFFLPLGVSAAWWSQVDRPESWRAASWTSSGMLPNAAEVDEAVIHVMAARTGGAKGAFSVHSWIVLKEPGSSQYERYDKVGWGKPIRRNAYAADAFWYSNPPFIVRSIRGKKADTLIPKVRSAIGTYPYSSPGDYGIWPGPNSNTFIAHILRSVPALETVLPPNAVGKDFLGSGFMNISNQSSEFEVSLFGLIGFGYGNATGIEFRLLGQTFGVDVERLALKLPGIGSLTLK